MTTTSKLRPAPLPLAAPAARPIAYLVALVLAAIAVVAGHDWLARMGAIERPELIAGFVDWLDQQGWGTVLLPASIIGVLVGLFLLFVAVKPRRRTHIRALGPVDQWLRPVDVNRIASRTARRCPGVYGATATTNGRAVTVTIDTGGGLDENALSAAVHDAVSSELAATLEDAPGVRVRLQRGNDKASRKDQKGVGS